MPKIQGKQISDKTITQSNLNLSLPLSGDTTSGATVNYVNSYVSTFVSNNSGTIGPAESGDNVYTDGIFIDFVPSTPIGTAIDRFNEVLLKLAPTPPNKDWSIFGSITVGSTYSATALGTTTPPINNISSTQTPTYNLSISPIGVSELARERQNITFVMSGNTTLETAVMTTGSTTRSGQIINWTVADPYVGAGRPGFWTGVTSMSVSGTAPTQVSSTSPYNLSFYHSVGNASPSTTNYYVNTVAQTSISNISATFPTMTRYISGVPSISTGSTKSITNISFTINNAIGYFYSRNLWNINCTTSSNTTYNTPTDLPTSYDQDVYESGKTIVIVGNSNTESMTLSIKSVNPQGTPGLTGTYIGVYRIDATSNETLRLTSGHGNYPSTGWGGTYDSTQILNNSNTLYSGETMMINNVYKYPTGIYSSFTDATNGAGPNYNSGISGTRWATFNLGNLTSKNFQLTINGTSGTITSLGQSNLLIQIKISGDTSWVDGNAAYGSGNPGSTINNGDAACVYGSSTPTVRYITFGGIVRSGNFIVRMGITQGSNVVFTSLSVIII